MEPVPQKQNNLLSERIQDDVDNKMLQILHLPQAIAEPNSDIQDSNKLQAVSLQQEPLGQVSQIEEQKKSQAQNYFFEVHGPLNQHHSAHISENKIVIKHEPRADHFISENTILMNDYSQLKTAIKLFPENKNLQKQFNLKAEPPSEDKLNNMELQAVKNRLKEELKSQYELKSENTSNDGDTKEIEVKTEILEDNCKEKIIKLSPNKYIKNELEEFISNWVESRKNSPEIKQEDYFTAEHVLQKMPPKKEPEYYTLEECQEKLYPPQSHGSKGPQPIMQGFHTLLQQDQIGSRTSRTMMVEDSMNVMPQECLIELQTFAANIDIESMPMDVSADDMEIGDGFYDDNFLRLPLSRNPIERFIAKQCVAFQAGGRLDHIEDSTLEKVGMVANITLRCIRNIKEQRRAAAALELFRSRSSEASTSYFQPTDDTTASHKRKSSELPYEGAFYKVPKIESIDVIDLTESDEDQSLNLLAANHPSAGFGPEMCLFDPPQTEALKLVKPKKFDKGKGKGKNKDRNSQN